MLKNQENVKSKSDKGYHAVPLPYTGNYIPPKPDLMFIDEQVKSESVDIVFNVVSSDVKTVESKHEPVDVKNKGVYSTEETKPVRKNSFTQPDEFIDWLSMVERVFDLRDILDHLKVKVVAIKLCKYASLWLRMRCGADEEDEQFWTLDDVTRLAFKVEKQLSSKTRTITTRPQQPLRQATPSGTNVRPAPTQRPKGTSMGNVNQTGSKCCFKCKGLGHYARECPNKQLVTFVDDTTCEYDTDGEDEVAQQDQQVV
nr:hypothetical protein [Tanacetum cinerariifolium]